MTRLPMAQDSEPEDDALARCCLLDRYWEALQSRSSPDPRLWLAGDDLDDPAIIEELITLKLLHELHESSSENRERLKS